MLLNSKIKELLLFLCLAVPVLEHLPPSRIFIEMFAATQPDMKNDVRI